MSMSTTSIRCISWNEAGLMSLGRPSTHGRFTILFHVDLSVVEFLLFASCKVHWDNSACRPQLLWEVLAAQHNATSGSLQWRTIARRVSASAYEANSLRCPRGCAFRVRPLEIAGWVRYSEPSAEVFGTPLQPPPPGAVRIELAFLPSSRKEYEPQSFALDLVADLSSVLKVDMPRLSFVEARGRGAYAIIDILTAEDAMNNGDGRGGDGGRTPLALAQDLLALVADKKSSLYQTAVAGNADPSASILLIAADGSVTKLEMAQSSLAGAAARITALLCLALGVVAAFCACRKMLRARSGHARRSMGKQYRRAAAREGAARAAKGARSGKSKRLGRVVEVEDDEEDEVEDDEEEEADEFKGLRTAA
eukprot:6209702-Pleurochrysis_carterae.AAC.3